MEQLGVALLGMDHWYSAFDLAEQAATSDQVRLVAIAHDDANKARETAQYYSAANWTTDYRAALDRPDVDIVAVLYSTDRSGAICREAAALGKHVISVKPMALDLAGADAIVDAVKAAGVHFYPLDALTRINPNLQRIKRWIEEGRIGRPLRYTQTLHSSLPQPWRGVEGPSWWLDPKRVPGGGWLDHAIYGIDNARWLLGAEITEVRGIATNQRYPDLSMEDYGAATFTFANGAVALIEDTWTSDRGHGFSRGELIGTAGAICQDERVWGRMAARGTMGFDGWVGIQPLESSNSGVINHLAAVVRGETAPLATIDDGRANLAASLAFYEAARIGKTVKL